MFLTLIKQLGNLLLGKIEFYVNDNGTNSEIKIYLSRFRMLSVARLLGGYLCEFVFQAGWFKHK